jgi:hypothetical protein
MGVLETMNLANIKADLAQLSAVSKSIVHITIGAKRAKKNLAGSNYYGGKFHDLLKEIAEPRTRLAKVLEFIGEDDELAEFSNLCDRIQSSLAVSKHKTEALREIELAWHTKYFHRIEHMSADPTPVTEQVLPMAVVTGIPVIERVVLQANGCYEHGWYDACSVMMRRVVETLIIEVYESEGRPQDIKDKNGEFRMLRDLVSIILGDSAFNLGRDVKRSLPLLKELGDRSAHKRRYNATQPDIEKVLSGFRVTVEELLHLAKLK